jgi:cobalt/nickel transport system permease protein
MLLHINVVSLAGNSELSTPWHRLTPRTRVLCALLFVFATALTPNGQWWVWAVYAMGLMALILLSQVTLKVLLKRVMVESAFIGVVLLGTLFRPGETVLWQWGWFSISTTGLAILGSVSLKALLCLLMLNLLTLTTPVPALLQALAELKCPPLLVAVIASMYRYLHLLIDEFQTMSRAASARNLLGSRHHQRLVIGNMIGVLFIRTYERGERIHQAMLARGYTGLPTRVEKLPGSHRDIWALCLLVLFILLGQMVYRHAS